MEQSSTAPGMSSLRGWRAACIALGGVGSVWTAVMLQPSPDAVEPMLSIFRVLAVLFGILCTFLGLVGLASGRRAARG